MLFDHMGSDKTNVHSFFLGESQRGRQIVLARRLEHALSIHRWKNIALAVVLRNVSGTFIHVSVSRCVKLSFQGGDEVK